MNIKDVLHRRFPGKEWTLVGDSYKGLTWLSEGPAPSEQELADLWPVVQEEIAAEAQAKADAKASAVAKLEALGLTVEEVSTVFGLEV